MAYQTKKKKSHDFKKKRIKKLGRGIGPSKLPEKYFNSRSPYH